MLSAFPYLLSFAGLAPLLLRMTAGIYTLMFAYEHLETKPYEIRALFADISLRPVCFFAYLIATLELAGGTLLVGGAWTQVAALSMAILMIIGIVIKKQKPGSISTNIHVYIFLLIILVSLVFTGPGAAGADYPF